MDMIDTILQHYNMSIWFAVGLFGTFLVATGLVIASARRTGIFSVDGLVIFHILLVCGAFLYHPFS